MTEFGRTTTQLTPSPELPVVKLQWNAKGTIHRRIGRRMIQGLNVTVSRGVVKKASSGHRDDSG